MRLACKKVRVKLKIICLRITYIFDIWAGVDSDHVTVLDSEVMPNNTVDTCASIIQIIVSKDDEDGILSLLALDKNCVTTEKLKCFHCVI